MLLTAPALPPSNRQASHRRHRIPTASTTASTTSAIIWRRCSTAASCPRSAGGRPGWARSPARFGVCASQVRCKNTAFQDTFAFPDPQNPSKPGTRQLCHDCWWAGGFHAVLDTHTKLLRPDALKPPPEAQRAWEAARPPRPPAKDETWLDVEAGGGGLEGAVRLRGKIWQVRACVHWWLVVDRLTSPDIACLHTSHNTQRGDCLLPQPQQHDNNGWALNLRVLLDAKTGGARDGLPDLLSEVDKRDPHLAPNLLLSAGADDEAMRGAAATDVLKRMVQDSSTSVLALFAAADTEGAARLSAVVGQLHAKVVAVSVAKARTGRFFLPSTWADGCLALRCALSTPTDGSGALLDGVPALGLLVMGPGYVGRLRPWRRRRWRASGPWPRHRSQPPDRRRRPWRCVGVGG